MRKILISFLLLVIIFFFFGFEKVNNLNTEIFPKRLIESFKSKIFKNKIKLNEVIILNTKNLKKEKILDVSKINWNLNIFEVNLEDIKEKLLDIKEIKSVKIKRTISGGIEIYIIEKIPFMYWEINGLKKVISNNGEVLHFPDFEEDLLFVKGENANFKIKMLMDKIKKHGFLANQFLSAEYIDNYRWNIYLKKNVLVKLPFEELTNSISLLDEIVQDNNFKKSNYRIIDMRVTGKIYFK